MSNGRERERKRGVSQVSGVCSGVAFEMSKWVVQ